MESLPFDTEAYEEQTELKHKVFREYFDAWVKILGSRFGRLNYIDGFAGLGAYVKNGEVFYGSPIIAAEVLRNNNRFVKHSTLVLIDNNKKTLENLRSVMKYKEFDNCPSMSFQFFNQDFNEAMDILMTDAENQNLAPTFAFIDPFGFEGIHFDTIKKIMDSVNKPEIIINFMFNAVTRFLKREDLKETFTRVFGTEEWQNIVKESEEREKCIIEFYVSKLKQISKFVFPYRLTFPDKNRTYYLLARS